MNYDELEYTYRGILTGYDEPDVLYMVGRVLLEFAHNQGDDDPRDVDGNKIDPGAGYCLTATGIYRLAQPEDNN